MGQLCLRGEWTDRGLTWSANGPLEGSSAQADSMMALYEEGNLTAQGGDLPKALALFQKGLSQFVAIDHPDAHQRVAEAALMWGLGTAMDRADRSQHGWSTLLRILRPGEVREQLPVGLAINWTHSAVLSGYRHDKYLEVSALLDALARLGWSDALSGSPDAQQAVRDRYAMLAPFQARCFEGLMQENRFEEATLVAERAIQTSKTTMPGDEKGLGFWQTLLALAEKRTPKFRLENLDSSGEGDGDEEKDLLEMPAVRVVWDGQSDFRWRRGPLPEDPNQSALARLYQQASQLADGDDPQAALEAYDKGLIAWDQLPNQKTCDALVRAMLLRGKSAIQERLAGDEPPREAWMTLMQVAHPGAGVPLPLPVLLSWTQSAVILATHLGLWNQVEILLSFLVQMALHPKMGQTNEEISQELMGRFLALLEGAFGALESQPDEAADWALSLQRRVEPKGMLLMPVRDLVFHALSTAGRHQHAQAVANEVLLWAQQENDPASAQEWTAKLDHARTAQG